MSGLINTRSVRFTSQSSLPPAVLAVLAGDTQGGGSPLVGGAGSIGACQRVLLARGVLPAWGDPARPGLSPEGKRERGDPIPCCRRLILHAARSPFFPAVNGFPAASN